MYIYMEQVLFYGKFCKLFPKRLHFFKAHLNCVEKYIKNLHFSLLVCANIFAAYLRTAFELNLRDSLKNVGIKILEPNTGNKSA